MLRLRDREVLTFIEVHKAISINQATKIFFKNKVSAKRRLKQLEELELLKSYENRLTGEKVYFLDRKLSSHDILIYDFYAKLCELGATINNFKKEPRYLHDTLRPDAFLEIDYKGFTYYLLLEVDLGHYTDYKKFQLYERLYKENELQKQCDDIFPQIVVLRATDHDVRYNSNNFYVVYLDFTMKKMGELLF